MIMRNWLLLVMLLLPLAVLGQSVNRQELQRTNAVLRNDLAGKTNTFIRGLRLPDLTASRPAVINPSGYVTNAPGTADSTTFLRGDNTLAVPPVPVINVTTNFLFFSTNFYVQNTIVSNYFTTNVFNDTYASNYFVTNIYQFSSTTNFYMSNIINNDTYISNFYVTNILVDNTYVSNYYATNLFLSTNVFVTNSFVAGIATNANQFGPSVTLTLKDGVQVTNLNTRGGTNFGTVAFQSDAGITTGDGTTYGSVGFLDASTGNFLTETWTNVTQQVTNVFETPWPVGLGWCYQVASSNGFMVRWTNGPCGGAGVSTNVDYINNYYSSNIFNNYSTFNKPVTITTNLYVNVVVVTNLYGSLTTIASNAATAQIDFSPGVGTTHYQVTNLANNITLNLTNLYLDTFGPRDAWIYFECDSSSHTVTVSTNGITTGTRVSWGFNSTTNGATSFTVTNRARLNLVRNRAGVISAAYEHQQ